MTDVPPDPVLRLLKLIEDLCEAIAQATGLNLFTRLMLIPVRRKLRGMAQAVAEVAADRAARAPDTLPQTATPVPPVCLEGETFPQEHSAQTASPLSPAAPSRPAEPAHPQGQRAQILAAVPVASSGADATASSGADVVASSGADVVVSSGADVVASSGADVVASSGADVVASSGADAAAASHAAPVPAAAPVMRAAGRRAAPRHQAAPARDHAVAAPQSAVPAAHRQAEKLKRDSGSRILRALFITIS